MNILKRCPCGQRPHNLLVHGANNAKYAEVYGSCCGQWSVEFRLNYYPIDSWGCVINAFNEWQRAPRGGNLDE